MAEVQQVLSPEEQEMQLVCDGIKKYIENMAIPDTAKQDYLTGVFNKYKDNPIIYFRLSFSIPSATIKALVKAQERL